MAFARLVLTALLWPSALVGGLICAAMAACAQLGRFNPTWDLLTHLAPFYLAGSLLALLLGLLFEGRARGMVMSAGAAGALLAGLLIAPEYLRDAGPTAAPGTTPALKIIQFNAWDGQGRIDLTADWLARQRPDVVVVEESNRRVRDAIVARTGWHVVQGRSPAMIFTPVPPLSSFTPPSESTGPMDAIGVTLKTGAGDATVVGVHYPWPTNPTLGARTKALKAVMATFPPRTTILSGDFNSTPWSFARQRDDRDFGLIRRTRGVFSWPTVRLPLAVLPIDHIYAGAGWATVKVERGPRLNSDHYPVIVTLAPVAPH